MAGGLKMKEETGEGILAGDIKSAVELILRDELDLNIMAFESLIALVDLLRMLPDVVLNACKTIIANDTKDISAFGIQCAIASLLQNGVLHEVDKGNSIISDFNETLRNLALCLLSKVFANLLDNGCLERAIQNKSEWFLDTLVPSLVDAVKSAKEHPYDALYATKCQQRRCTICTQRIQGEFAASFTPWAEKCGGKIST
eukprot:3929662-Ditylum_brightwellii.AAC.1